VTIRQVTVGQPADRLAKSYARWRSSRLGQITDTLEQRLLLELLGPVAGKTLLDVGCGDGVLAVELSRHGALAAGLDADPAMISAARRRAESEATPSQFVEGRAEALPFQDNAFDRVLSVTMLCFVQDVQRAVAEMARVLKPGGRLVIGDLGRWSLWSAYRRVRGWFGSPTWRAAKFCTAEGLRRLVTSAGLEVLEIRGAVYYPPCAVAAWSLAPFDFRIGQKTAFGSAFLALRAVKPSGSPRSETV
jgi:ubiquinone/menaquinone biosynthesis C-methylase UbiE